MHKSISAFVLAAFLVLVAACGVSPSNEPVISTPSSIPTTGVTPAAPTPLAGSTAIPWWGATIAILDGEPTSLGKPTDLSIAPDGTIYVADAGTHMILHINANRKVLHAWGGFSGAGQAAPTGTFNEPWGITVTPDGLVYVADTWNHRIQVFQLDGSFVQTWGEPGQGTGPYQLFGPRDVAVNPDGFVFVSDTGNKRIVVYDLDGLYVGQLGGEGSGPGQFNEPVGIAIGADGDLYVADQGNRRVQVLAVADDGMLSPKSSWPVEAWETNDMQYKPYICVLEERVFITDPESGAVQEYAPGGELLHTYTINTSGYLNYGIVYGIAADADGGLWVSDLAGGAGILVKIYPGR